MNARKSLSRPLAVVLALAGYWLMTIVDYWLLGRHERPEFSDLLIPGPFLNLQIGLHYLGWISSQGTAALTAGVIVACSNFSRPVRATFWIMLAYHSVFFAIRMFHWPWVVMQDLNQAIPVVFEVIAMLLLIGLSMGATWFWRWLLAKQAQRKARAAILDRPV